MLAAIALAAVILAALAPPSLSCTNMLVDPAASSDGSAIIAYNADSATVYGMLYHYPAADHAPNATREIYNWDSGAYLGSIPEAAHTYNVVGNTNEYGLTIGETTFGGISLLGAQAAAKVDYGAVIWVTLQVPFSAVFHNHNPLTTLQRARTAREAISVMGQLVKEYGYGSEGESFSIGDPNEVWIMEMISKGEFELGAVWVAVRRIAFPH
jgi:dipeptidase